MNTAMKRFSGVRISNSLLRVISFISNVYTAGILSFGAQKGLEFTTRKFTIDKFGPGIWNKYQVIAPIDHPVSDIQSLWTYCVILQYLLGRFVAIPFIAALASHELWLRRINDTAQARGKSLGPTYKPQLHRCELRWPSIIQWTTVIVLTLATLAASLLVTFGAWVVEDRNHMTGISLRLNRLNETIYYGNLMTKESVNSPNLDWSDLRDDGFIHVANPTIAYNALYPGDKLDIPSEMRNTAYYLPRSSFPALESHLLMSARRELRLPRDPLLETATARANLTDPGDIRLGDAVYTRMQTMGIGVNMSSYRRFMGDGLPGLPRDYDFAGMQGQAYGNTVGVQCRDRTDQYNFLSIESNEGDTPTMNYIFGSKRSGNPTQELPHLFTVPASSATGPLIFSHLTLSNKSPIYTRSGSRPGQPPTRIPNNIPLHTLFIIPNQKPFPKANQVLQCLYWPYELAINYVLLPDPASPLMMETRNDYPPPDPRCLSPIYALPAARAIHELLTTDHRTGGKVSGGVLAKVWREYYDGQATIPGVDPWATRGAAVIHQTFVELILSATAQGYFSLLRQRVEIANIWLPYDQGVEEGRGQLTLNNIRGIGLTNGMVFDVLRVGGSAPYKLHYVGILVMMLIGANRLTAAWRSLVFGRGERRYGRWWERDLVKEVVLGGGESETAPLLDELEDKGNEKGGAR